MFWCWLQELICSCADIVPPDDVDTSLDDESAQQATNSMSLHTEKHEQHHGNTDVWPSNPAAMFRTIAALLDIADYQAGSIKQTNATNTTNISNPCDGSVDEIDSYNQYFKQIGIHFQKTKHSLLDIQHDSCAAEHNTSHIDSDDPLNEYCLNDDDFDCSASNANDSCDTEAHAMQSSLCSSASTNQQPNAHDPYIEPDNELSNDCSIQINSIKSSASNSNNNFEAKVIANERPMPIQTRRKTPNTLNLILPNTRIYNSSNGNDISPKDMISTKKRKISNLKRTYKQMNRSKYSDRISLNGITEECEYDSDIGKFNCKINNAASDQLMSDTSSGSYEFSEETATIRTNSASSNEDQSLNDLNLTPNNEKIQSIESFNINNSDKIVTKRIEFFENMSCKQESELEQDQNQLQDGNQLQDQDRKQDQEQKLDLDSKPEENENTQVTTLDDIICLISFVFAVVFMYFFPLIC